MQKDHTYEVEKKEGAVLVTRLDNCSFYLPNEKSYITVKLCAYCRFGYFKNEEKNGLCIYYLHSQKN